MLTQDEIERERYDARFKALSDHATYMKEAREEGLRSGKFETINTLEQLLHRPETPAEVMQKLTLGELSNLVTDLKRQLAERS